MPFTIEIDDREWDVENLLSALQLPARRHYVAELTTDEPAHGQVVFHGDVQLVSLCDDVLTVWHWSEDGPYGAAWTVDVADIRRICFY